MFIGPSLTIVRPQSAGSEAFDPLTLNPDYWIKFDEADGRWQDEAKTTAASSNSDPVAVKVESANSYEIAIPAGQTTQRPTVTTNGVLFDGVDDNLLHELTTELTQPHTVVLSFSFVNAASALTYIYDGPSTSSAERNFAYREADEDLVVGGNASATVSTTLGTAEHVLTVESNGTSSNVWLDGTQVVTNGNLGTTIFHGIKFARRFTDFSGNGFEANIVIRRCFIKEGTLTAGERANVEAACDIAGAL